MSTGDVAVRTVDFVSHQEHVLNVSGDNGDAMQEVLRDVADELNAQIIGQFTFAGCDHFDTAGPLDWPFSWLQGDACKKGEMTSMQAVAVSGVDLQPIKLNGQTVGYFYEDEHARYCRLAGLQPGDADASREAQTRSLFERMANALKQCDMKFADTVRTWLYLDQLLDWYDEFNAVRTQFFEEHGVFDKMVPASTGIGACNPQGAAITADLLAIVPKSDAVTIQAVESPLQESAMDYRSSFSRAAEVGFPTHRTIYISGTASIEPKGETVHLDDSEAQIALTMEVVKALLNSRDMDWSDVTRGIAYFKNSNDLKIYQEFCEKHDIPEFPLAISHADVCRHNLLFEIEIDATKAK
ncbi:Rid family hydrolase [Verrucomicrobiota bacterium]